MKIAALGDIHMTERTKGRYNEIFERIGQEADILCLCGDLTDHGEVKEVHALVDELQHCPIPKVAVLGNHDYDAGVAVSIKQTLQEANIFVVSEEPYTLENIAFVGVKGFGGGYGKHMLGSFGERTIKDFVLETINEAEQLDVLLDQTDRVSKIIVLMHYSPIAATNKGEPLEIYPYLGSSRFEDVIDRFDVATVFHAHAHYGSLEGKTSKNIPVYNVAFPLLQKHTPKKPYKIVEI